ncbi:hypothetical protein ABVC73_06930 [Prevotella melaninogenica]
MKKALDCVYRIFGRLAAIDSDKYLHMFAGLVVSMISCKALHAIDAYLILALVPAFFVMTGKESADYYYRKELFDWVDVCAGMLGAIVGVFLFLL